MNEGAQRLLEGGLSLAEVRDVLAKHGVTVTRTTVGRWRSGEKVPSDGARVVLERKPTSIPRGAWDAKLGAGVSPLSPSPGAVKRTAKRAAPRAGVTPPEAVTPTTAGPGAVVAGADLARDYLDRVTSWRKASEETGSPAVRVKFAQLERQAIALYLQATGQATATELEIGRSPQWARLRGELLATLERHPDAARAVLAVMDRHAPQAEGTGA